MKKAIILYSLAIAMAAFAMHWLEYRHAVRTLSTQLYIAIIALAFTLLGVWAGNRLTRRPAPPTFEKNTRALASLGISDREYQVLLLLAEGHPNKQIARLLGVSPNTIKTHLSRLYDKLHASRRTQAIAKARSLRLIQ